MFKKLFERYSQKTAITIIALTLILAVGVASTLAYIVAETLPLTNVFTPGEIIVTVNDNNTFTVTGDVDQVYVRVAVVVNFQNDAGNVYGLAPVSGTHYTVETAEPGWTQSGEYYYYNTAVNTGVDVPFPVKITDKTADVDASLLPSDANYELTVQYLVTAIQATPGTAVTEAWGFTPSN